MAAQGVVQSGARWRVGVGDQVKIWQDPLVTGHEKSLDRIVGIFMCGLT